LWQRRTREREGGEDGADGAEAHRLAYPREASTFKNKRPHTLSCSPESVALKGVAYYPRPNDGLLDTNNLDFFHDDYRQIWERDIEYFKDLGINALRIYAVDPMQDHGSFFCALQEAGIYVLVGLAANCKDCAVTKDAAPACYPPTLKSRGQQIISTFSKYDNVLGFSAGNEVGLVSPDDQSANAPCVKAFMRDMRAYIAGCPQIRQIPVGLVIADIERAEKLAYFNCGDDPFEYAEFLGINAYQHCDANVTTLEEAIGFQMFRDDLGNYSIPALLTEYGCLNPSFPTVDGYEAQRTFVQSEWIYEPEFYDIFQGGFVFEFSVEVRFFYTSLLV
jgi:hypothetical protein